MSRGEQRNAGRRSLEDRDERLSVRFTGSREAKHDQTIIEFAFITRMYRLAEKSVLSLATKTAVGRLEIGDLRIFLDL